MDFVVKRKWSLLLIIAVILLIVMAVMPSNMFIADHKNNADLTKDLSILLVFNGSHDIEAENLLASIKLHAPELIPYLTVCISDAKSKLFATRHNLTNFTMPEITASGYFNTKAMNIMMARKLECIVHELELGRKVLYIDTDIVILKNPLKYLNSEYELTIQNDQCRPPYDKEHLCAGFMFVQPSSRSIQLFQEVLKFMQKYNYQDICDQRAINMLITRSKFPIKLRVLDACKFPNGCRYFENTDPKCQPSEAVIVHNNHLVGIDKKMARFQEHNLLFNTLDNTKTK